MGTTLPTDDDYQVVSSSNLAAVAYLGGTLWVRFVNGGEGYYSNVPEALYRSLMNAPSKGKFHSAHFVKAKLDWTSVKKGKG